MLKYFEKEKNICIYKSIFLSLWYISFIGCEVTKKIYFKIQMVTNLQLAEKNHDACY